MRYEMTIGRDSQMREEGDLALLGVDERRDPRQLEPGLCSRAINKDFNQGVAMTRPGMQTVGWAAERALNFPIDFFPGTYDWISLFTASADVTGMNARIQNGTTLELYCPDTGLWHAVWLEQAGGSPALKVAITGSSDAYTYAAYNESAANFRMSSSRTLQIYNTDTAGFHTIWLQGTATSPLLVLAPTASTPAAPTDGNYLVVTDTDLLLYNTEANTFHRLWISMQGGGPALAIESGGIAEGVDFDIQTGFGTVYGADVFSDPYGTEGALVAVGNGIYRVRSHQELQLIQLPANELIDDECRMIQCFDRVVILRGTGRTPLVWNPEQGTDTGLGTVETVEQTNARNTDADNTYGDGTLPIPAVSDGVLHNNRLFLIQNRDELVVSDILDYTRYSEATQRFKINAGEDDQLIRLIPYNQTTIILFKEQSVYALNNVFGNLQSVSADVLSLEYGLVGRDAVLAVGKDVLFLSDTGVFALSQALDNKLQASSEPISAPIQPIIDRINWGYASAAQMDYHDNRMFLAVPLDGATYNNAILVYNFLNRSWSGYWTGELVDVKRFFRINYLGRRELWFVTGTSLEDEARHGAPVLMNRDFQDYAFGTWIDITDELVTRGYAMASLNQKNSRRVVVDLSSWAGSYNVSILADGVNENRVGLSRTPSRTRFMVWGKADYDTTNADDNHTDPYREDYSVRMTEDTELLLQSGIGLNRLQRRQEALQPRMRGGHVRVKITNTSGRCGIHGVTQEAMIGRRSMTPYS